MGLISVPSDPIPGWAKIDLQLHEPIRGWFGFGRLRCAWCGAPWDRHGCPTREFAARTFVAAASPAQKEAALVSGELTDADLQLRWSRPNRHRRGPKPVPQPHPLLGVVS